MRNLLETIQIRPLSDSALVVQVGEGINEVTHTKVKTILNLLEKNPFSGFIEAVPAYNSVTVYYNPINVYFSNLEKGVQSPYENAKTKILSLMNQSNIAEMTNNRLVKIPVAYGGEMGPDLEFVASYNGLTPSEVIKIHSSAQYLVYMLGFAPGFPFMGGMDKQIATPRKESPRLAIAPGSVGIAGSQTGIYPLETPGGWQIIGRTPSRLFLPEQSPPTLLQPGDRIQFVPISVEDYAKDLEVKSWE
ncbi:5-oxoprolinase subunit PxpB [Solibacillus sp. MA9]|uniref:5-oxoprolinase subunit PxpB n=1 Tax=Solibacillus palustris TaxID=2908203 RepID=A0ABS9UFL3_9BACL|nr:5-oxoprolinase subunit PxpB [Solibacillus sp. MA9]MCH7323156.1 5-oxoprolinase subunit PxpB [Solibacillus sp. MA9]